MKKKLNLGLILIMALACDANKPSTINNIVCGDFEVVKEASSRNGIVGYNPFLKKYVIFSGIDGTYDSQDAGIVCGSLPSKFQVVDLQIIFSGKYYNYPGEINNKIPGQTYFYLDIDEISLKNKN